MAALLKSIYYKLGAIKIYFDRVAIYVRLFASSLLDIKETAKLGFGIAIDCIFELA